MNGYNSFFDDNYKLYEKVRPEYPTQLFNDIISYNPVINSSRVFEIGIGTGKATQFFIDKGCQIASLEPGVKMAKFVRNKFKDFDDFSCYNMTLEKYMGMNNTFDIIYSATALHWIDEKTAYEKIFKLLKSDGVLARFAYHAGRDSSRPSLRTEIDKLYNEYMPSDREYKQYSEDDAKALCHVAEKYGFTDCTYKMYEFSKDFTSKEYIELLSTYPDHMNIEEEKRKEFFKKIRKAIDAAGGIITVNYTVDMQLARKSKP